MKFLTIGDQNYFDTIALSIFQINNIHPGTEIVVYDWGFTDAQRQFLDDNETVRRINWRNSFIADPYDESYLKIIKRNYRKLRTLVSDLKKFYNKTPLREQLLAQKVYCFEHFIDTYRENFIFLDGDAFLYNTIDEIMNPSFDIGITVRRRKEFSMKWNKCQIANTGVIVFAGGYGGNKKFITAWINEMKRTNEFLIEQSAITRMLFSYNKENLLKYCDKGFCTLNGINYGILSSEKYNYNWIEEGVDRDRNYILHFKGGRHTRQNLFTLLRGIDLQDAITYLKCHNLNTEHD